MRDSASKSWMVEETFLSQASTSSTSINSTSSGPGPEADGQTSDSG